MPSSRLLPPSFLLPSWTPTQLTQLTKRSPNSTYSKKPRRTALRADAIPSPEPKKPAPSLFEQLFPEDAYAQKRARAQKKERKLDKLPTFEWRNDLPPVQANGWRNWAGSSAPSQDARLKVFKKESKLMAAGESRRSRRPAVLLISALSKSLEESDFLRLSSKGEHIEGWKSGIMKVIQARDPTTLSPLSFYFLLFSNRESCTTYHDALLRLHKISQIPSFIKRTTLTLPPELQLREGEDVDSLLRSFTLVTPKGKLSMRIIKEPFTPFIRELVARGTHAALRDQEGKGDSLVLLSTENGAGRFSELDIMGAIEKSGRNRNLPWKLAGGRRDVEKLKDGGMINEDEEGRGRVPRGKSRFVVAFKDRNEARRFVREWHKERMPVRRRDGPLMDVAMLW